MIEKKNEYILSKFYPNFMEYPKLVNIDKGQLRELGAIGLSIQINMKVMDTPFVWANSRNLSVLLSKQ